MAACDFHAFRIRRWCGFGFVAPAGRYSADQHFCRAKIFPEKKHHVEVWSIQYDRNNNVSLIWPPQKRKKNHLFQTMIFREGYKHVSIQQYPLVFFIVFFWEEGSFNGWRCFQRCFQLHWLGRTTLAPDVFFLGSRRFLLGTFRLLGTCVFFFQPGSGWVFVPSIFFSLIHSLELRFVWSFNCFVDKKTLIGYLAPPQTATSRESSVGKRNQPPSWLSRWISYSTQLFF